MDMSKVSVAMDAAGAFISLGMRLIDAVRREDAKRVDEILASPLAIAVEREAARARAEEKFGNG